ncbi:MAG: heparinase II/III family protein [Planctomycetota bacterium]
MENYPLRQKQVGWDPYPTSLRLINLCGVFFNKYQVQTKADTAFLHRLWSSIYIQAEWITKHLETHLLGNHLFENGAALAVVGGCFSDSTAMRWLRLGKSILEKEIPEQMLGDGMHFERSPMYHCRITYLLAFLYNTSCSELVDLVISVQYQLF